MQKNGRIISLFHLLLHIFAYSAMFSQTKSQPAGRLFQLFVIPEDSLRNYILHPEGVLR